MAALSTRVEKNPFFQLRHIPGQPVSYLQNPKVATKSIEFSLWHAHDPEHAPSNPHAVKQSPFIRGPRELSESTVASLMASRFFSVVRNPYARFISGYLNKVKLPLPWQKTSKRFGLPPERQLSIEQFADVVKAADPYDMDPHFAPQHINLMHGFIPLDFVGYLEDMHAVSVFFESHGFKLRSNRMNSTSSADLMADVLTPHIIKTTQEVFAKDFELFGYSEDPKKLLSIRAIHSLDGNRETLKKYLSTWI